MKQAALLWLYGVLILTSSLKPAFGADPQRRPAPPPQPEASCRCFPEWHNDFAWENDLVAFRVFGPDSPRPGATVDGGIECWPKRVNAPVAERWIASEKAGKPLREDRGQGYAFYQVGASRGCGGTALWEEGRKIPPGVYRTWSILSPGKSKCEFELTYDYPSLGGEPPVRETKKISLEPGQRFFRAESTFTRDGQPVAHLPVAIGLTTHDDKATVLVSRERRWVACWENINDEFLGTGAILAPNQPFETRTLHSPLPDQSHVLILTETNAQGKIVYYAGFAWNKASKVGSEKEWQAAIEAFSNGL